MAPAGLIYLFRFDSPFPGRSSMYKPPDQSDPATSIAIRISVALVFTLTGLDKFLQSPHWDHVFKAIGWGQWFRYFTGAVEILGGLMFLLPVTTTLGAALLVATMLGAMTVQFVVFHRPADSLFPGAYLAGVIAAYLKLRSGRRRDDDSGQ